MSNEVMSPVQREITPAEWEAAYAELQGWIQEYAAIPSGTFALNTTLFPLRNRYLKDERTRELYDEMQEVH